MQFHKTVGKLVDIINLKTLTALIPQFKRGVSYHLPDFSLRYLTTAQFLYCKCVILSIISEAICGPYFINASSPGYAITDQDYIERLGEHWQCSWVIEAPGNDYGVKLTVEYLHLAAVPKTKVNFVSTVVMM